jgi:SnoaL-like domain
MTTVGSASDVQVGDIVLIDQLVSAYAHAVDAYRFDDYAALFTDDGVLEIVWQEENGDLHPINAGAGCRLTGHSEIVEFLKLSFGSPEPRPRRKGGAGHEIVNRWIDVQGDTGIVRAVKTGGVFQYENDVIRVPEGWRFNRVLIIFNEDETLPVPTSPEESF